MDYIALLKSGIDKWAAERMSNPAFRPILRDVNLAAEFGGPDFYDLPEFAGVDFSNSDMHMASLRNCSFFDCNFDDARLTCTDMVDAYFVNCTFRRTCMRVSKIGDAKFEDCVFENCDMSYCSAEETSFKSSTFTNTKMKHMSLVHTDFSNAKLEGCFLYGISSWDLNLDNTCPYCDEKLPVAGETDLATLHPDLIKWWDRSKNEKPPERYFPDSSVRAYWFCEDGHRFRAPIREMVLRWRCPHCERKRTTL